MVLPSILLDAHFGALLGAKMRAKSDQKTIRWAILSDFGVIFVWFHCIYWTTNGYHGVLVRQKNTPDLNRTRAVRIRGYPKLVLTPRTRKVTADEVHTKITQNFYFNFTDLKIEIRNHKVTYKKTLKI